MKRLVRSRGLRLGSPALALLVLLGMAWESSTRPGPGQSEGYHRRVAAAAAALPLEVGPWSERNETVAEAAVTLLKPNALVNRVYTDGSSGQSLAVLFVHCRDARDMIGHYPPVCYPASGWTLISQTPERWDAGGMELQGASYVFRRRSARGVQGMQIRNIMLLPDGRVTASMNEVHDLAADYGWRHYGAGQLQVLFPMNMPPGDRDAAFDRFITASREVWASVLDSGQSHPAGAAPRGATP